MAQFGDSKLITFLVSISAIYFASLPIGLPHIGFIIGLILVLLHIRDRNNSTTIFWIFYIICFGIFYLTRGSSWKALVNNISSMLMYPIVVELLKKATKDRLVKLITYFIKYTIIAVIIETTIRYSLSTISPVSSGIYNYKFHSIMFQDTNFLGLVMLVVIFMIKYLKIFYHIKTQNRNYYIAIILLFLSLSRSAMLAWFIGELICFHMNKINFKKVLLKKMLLLTIIGGIFGSIIFISLYQDPSFRSKLYILDLMKDNYTELSKYQKFGVGYDNATEYLGIFPHNAVLVYFLDTGYFGLIFKSIFLIYIFIRTHWQGVIIFIPFFIASMSAIGYATHYLYVTLALITILSNQNKHQSEGIPFNSRLQSRKAH